MHRIIHQGKHILVNNDILKCPPFGSHKSRCRFLPHSLKIWVTFNLTLAFEHLSGETMNPQHCIFTCSSLSRDKPLIYTLTLGIGLE